MRKLAFVIAALAACATGAALAPRPALSDGVPLSQSVYDRKGRLLRLALSADGAYRVWVPLRDISPLVVQATLLHEDRDFLKHGGVDFPALLRSAWITYGKGTRRVGGSTITMQLARMRYRIDSRSPAGKMRQIVRAFQLEALYSKEEILEAYLNLVPYGGNVEGVGAASLIFFGKNADQLTLSEALTLAVVPQNPVRRTLTGANPADAQRRENARRGLLQRWLERRPEDRAQSAALLQAPGARLPSDLPFEAPHFVNAALARSKDPRIVTTLDLDLQRLAERVVRGYVERRKNEGVRNAAVLLVDHRTMEVLACVGSADFRSAAISGQVDGTRAKRSPGSSLKPFVYGLALDAGLIHERTVLKDAPAAFGAFNPENFDGEFSGPIPARDALAKSRNVPAVALAAALPPPGLYGLLKEAGADLPKPPEHYGLGLALGGAEVTMEDLARLYAALPNGGAARPLRRRLDEPQRGGPRLLSREASFVALQMLRSPRPEQRWRGDWTAKNLPVHWKTGTSMGFRDAWTSGVFGRYAMVVWIGEFDGRGSPAFVGVEAAAPLFFELVDAIRAREPGLSDAYAASEQTHGLDVKRIEVCAASGRLPGAFCPRRVEAWFIPGVSPIAECDVHREVLVDAKSGLRSCKTGPDVKPAVFEFWSTDLLRLFARAGIARRTPPDYDPSCGIAAKAPGAPPRITSPLAEVTYELRVGADPAIPLSATADADAVRLHWFVDDRAVADAEPGKPVLWPAEPGRYVVRVVDDKGRSDAREITVAVSE